MLSCTQQQSIKLSPAGLEKNLKSILISFVIPCGQNEEINISPVATEPKFLPVDPK